MPTRSRNAVQIVALSLMFAALLQGDSLTSYAQSSNERSKKMYFIQGAVKNPGAYEVEGEVYLLKLIALAGMFTESCGPVAYILRERKQSETPGSTDFGDLEFQVISISIIGMLKSREPFDLEPGDTVNIPQADVFLVGGEVMAPGSFPFKEGVTLLQAISAARGVTVSAKAHRVAIFRLDQTSGKRRQISVDLDAVKSGKQKDIPLLPYDLIIVPNARARTTPRFPDAPPGRVFASLLPRFASLYGGQT